MSEFLAPGVYIEEVAFGAHPIEGVSTSTAGFIGAADGPRLLSGITSFKDFERQAASGSSLYLSSGVRGFFDNGGQRCSVALIAATDPVEAALEALSGEPVSILCCPDENVFSNAASVMAEHCERRRDRFCILQSPQPTVPISTHLPPVRSSYAAYYHPWLIVPTSDRATTVAVPPGGHVAGVYARTDIQKGVWKAPAGRIERVTALSENITSSDVDLLVDRGIDVLRNEPIRGIVVWAARTTSSDQDWKYVNVRRLLIFIEHSLQRGLQWVVFELNGIALADIVTRAINAFLAGLWKSGALMGQTADEAYFVRCDRTTMTQDDIDNGRLIAVVGVAPVHPAEFVILRITCLLQSATRA
jgi:uncharacterized protein